MAIEKFDIFGTPAVGIFACATDRFCIVPASIRSAAIEHLEATLQVPCIKLEVAFKRLIGVMMVANSKGVLVPNHVDPKDEEEITKVFEAEFPDVKIHMLNETKLNALGNLIATNDSGAVASSKFQPEILPVIQETLGVQVIPAKIATSPLVGTKIVANSKGTLVTPLATNDEAEAFRAVFNTESWDFSTVCLGMDSLHIGMIANSNGAVVGSSTSGPELARISDILGV